MHRNLALAFAVLLLASSTSWGQDRGRKGRERGPGEFGRGEQLIQQLFTYGDTNRDQFLNAAEFTRTKAALGQLLARQRGATKRPGRGGSAPERERGEKGGERGREGGGPNLAAFNSNPDKNNDKAVSLNEFTDWVHTVMGTSPRQEGEERRRPERKAD